MDEQTRAIEAATWMLALLAAFLSSDVIRAQAPQQPASLKGIQISFKLDSRLNDSTYGGDRWVSPPTFAGAYGQDTFDVRALGVDASGKPTQIAAQWIPSDPGMVSVTNEADAVKITVKRAGESKLRVVAHQLSKELAIKAISGNNRMLVQFAQIDSKPTGAVSDTAALENLHKPLPPVWDDEVAKKNKAEGEAFLAANKKKDGVVTLASGLQYRIVKAGEGKRPTLDSSVVCQYRGTLIDGTPVVGTSNGAAPAFVVKMAIPGLSEALRLMPVGSEWRLFVPPSLAFGEGGWSGSRIGPNATLIFDVALVSIADASSAQKIATEPTSPQPPHRRRR